MMFVQKFKEPEDEVKWQLITVGYKSVRKLAPVFHFCVCL